MDGKCSGNILVKATLSSCLSSCGSNQAKSIYNFDTKNIVAQKIDNSELTVYLANNNQAKLLGVSFDNLFSGKIAIYDMNGRIVHSIDIAKNEETSSFSIDTANFVSGIYVISFQNMLNKVVSEKITIQ